MSQQKIEIAEAKIKIIQREHYLVKNQRHIVEDMRDKVENDLKVLGGISRELKEYEFNLLTGRMGEYKDMENYYKWKAEIQQDNIKEYKKEMSE